MAISKNATPEEARDVLGGLTAVELLRMSGPKMRDLIYGKGGGRVPRPGVVEAIEERINTWRNIPSPIAKKKKEDEEAKARQ
jgi:hypothetical protein